MDYPSTGTISPSERKRGQFAAVVIENARLCREHFGLRLRLSSFPQTRPGQFVQVACRDIDTSALPEADVQWNGQPASARGKEFSSPTAFLRRPFSLAGRHDLKDGGVEIELIHRVVGVATSWLGDLKPGDGVNLLGPLGNAFKLPPPGRTALMIGGGVGIPPMLYLAGALGAIGGRGIVFAGALSRDLLPLTLENDQCPAPDAIDALLNVTEFSRHGVPAVLSTDDGSYGFRGFVTQALERYLDQFFPDSRENAPILYTCGPEPMMKRVADIAAARNLEVQIAVERAMACGMGTCQSCCIRVRKADPSKPPLAGSDWAYRLACTDGPIFAGPIFCGKM